MKTSIKYAILANVLVISGLIGMAIFAFKLHPLAGILTLSIEMIVVGFACHSCSIDEEKKENGENTSTKKEGA